MRPKTLALSGSFLAAVLAGCNFGSRPPAASTFVASTSPTAPVLDPGVFASPDNLALNRPASASASLPDRPASAAVDGDLESFWVAGSHPTQWIEIDLGALSDVERMILVPSQDPAGATVHRILGGPESGSLELLHEFRGDTSDGVPLEVSPIAAWRGLRYLRIETTESPSWVAWREVAVFGRAAGPSSVSRPGDAVVAMSPRSALAWIGR